MNGLVPCVKRNVYIFVYVVEQCRHVLIILEACIYILYGMLVYIVHCTCKHVKKHLEFQNIWMRYLN